MIQKYTAQDFLEMFSAVKSKEKKRKSTTRLLLGRTERNFKKLVQAGYTPEEFEAAAVAMFRSPDQWAIQTGNDTPDHLLQPEVFSRYLNSAMNPNGNKDPNKIILNAPQKVEESEAPQYSEDEVNESKEIYSQSLKAGKWKGRLIDAIRIGALFTNDFTFEEKIKFLNKAKTIVSKDKDTARQGGAGLAEILERMARRYPKNIMFELAIKEAIKRKISEPWKR